MVTMSKIISIIKAEEKKKQQELAFQERQKKYKESKQKDWKMPKKIQKSKNAIKKPLYIAELKRWDDRVDKQVIEREWIDDMVFAVRSQSWVQNNKTGLIINGAKYRHIDVYEIE